MFEVKIMSILTETHMYAQVKEYITHDKLHMQLLYFQKKGKRKRLTLTGKETKFDASICKYAPFRVLYMESLRDQNNCVNQQYSSLLLSK